MTADATWLPNLVGGTSIWKLAVDLNEPKFFDGRLLVPETEGSESLPVTVRWDLTGLVPLAEATAKHPFETNQATQEFQAALDRVAIVFRTPNSGFDKYKDAFTVPSLEADGGGNYFYSPAQKKLFVINWGASPRSMGGKAEYVFGYEDWGKKFEDKAIAPAPAVAPIAAAAAVGGAAVAAAAAVEAPKEEKKDEPKKPDDARKKPWWIWLLFALVVVGIVLLVLFLLKACDEPKGVSADAAAEAAALEAGADAATDAEVDAATLADAGDAAAASDAGDAGALADAGDAGSDAGKDGGLAMNDDDDDDGPAGSSGGAGGGAGAGGPVTVTIGPAGGGTGPKAGPHRKHYMDQAQAWRVVGGKQKVSRTEQSGHRYDVWLGAGQTFEGVRVEWQDSAGKWHVH